MLRHSRRTAVIIMLLRLAPDCSVLSQPPAPGGELEALTLEDLLNVPIEASTLASERPSDSPATAHVITEETIRARGYATLLDLLEDIPQIEIQHSASVDTRNTITSQGINSNERLQIFIDGVRVTPVTGNFYALGRQFSLRNAKQVEIILGPMSALYGADAFTGVINIVTKTGREMEGGGLSGSYGSYDTRDYSVVVGKRLDSFPFTKTPFLGNSGIAITAHGSDSAGAFMPGYYPGEFSWYNSQFQSGRMRNSPRNNSETIVPFRGFSAGGDSRFIHARLNMDHFEIGWIRMSESHSSSLGIRPEFTLYVEDAVFRTNYETVYGNYVFSSEDEKWVFNTMITKQSYEIDPRTKFIDSFSGYEAAYKYARDKSSVIDEKVTCKIGEKSLLLFGLSYQDNMVLPRTGDLSRPYDTEKSADSQAFVYPGSDITVNGKYLGIPQDFYFNEYTNTGAYAQLQFREYFALQATLGLRYDRNSRYGDSFNPRTGIVFKPGEKMDFKVLYGEAFLAPSPAKTYYHYGSFFADPATATGLRSDFFHLPNTDLKPEKIRSVQGGANYRFTDSLWTSVNAYQSYVYDEIFDGGSTANDFFKGTPVALTGHFINSQKLGRIYGWSARLDSITRVGQLKIDTYAAYAYSRGYSEQAQFLPYSAASSVRAGMVISRGRWSVSSRLIFQTESYSLQPDFQNNRQKSAPFAVVNLYARYRGAESGRAALFFFLDVRNLSDARYYNPAQPPLEGFGANPQEPISVSGGLTLDF